MPALPQQTTPRTSAPTMYLRPPLIQRNTAQPSGLLLPGSTPALAQTTLRPAWSRLPTPAWTLAVQDFLTCISSPAMERPALVQGTASQALGALGTKLLMGKLITCTLQHPGLAPQWIPIPPSRPVPLLGNLGETANRSCACRSPQPCSMPLGPGPLALHRHIPPWNPCSPPMIAWDILHSTTLAVWAFPCSHGAQDAPCRCKGMQTPSTVLLPSFPISALSTALLELQMSLRHILPSVLQAGQGIEDRTSQGSTGPSLPGRQPSFRVLSSRGLSSVVVQCST